MTRGPAPPPPEREPRDPYGGKAPGMFRNVWSFGGFWAVIIGGYAVLGVLVWLAWRAWR